MTVVNPKSISGITSITTASGSDDLLSIHSNNGTEKLRINASGQLIFDGDSNTHIARPAADTFAFTTGGSERLRIDSSGNFGIGVSPSSILHVRPLDETNFLVRNEGSTVVLASETNSGRDNNRGMALEATQFEFIEGGSEKVRIDSSGRLLIGTTTEGEASADNLTVADSAHAGITIRSGTTSYGSLFFSDATSGADEYSGSIEYKHSDNFLMLRTAATERLRIDSSGRLLVGQSASYNVFAHSKLQVSATDSTAATSITRWSANAFGPYINFGKSRAGTAGSYTVVQDDDVLGTINFAAADGTDLESTASKITCEVDGTPGGNDVPGRLAFWTTSDGGYQPTERLRITSNGTLQLYNSPGIDFSQIQTNAGGMTSELLDWYEEGTFTPTILPSSSSSIGYTKQNGAYTRIGRLVTLTIFIQISSDTSSGQWSVGGFPFTVGNILGDTMLEGGMSGGYQNNSAGTNYSNIGFCPVHSSTKAEMYRVQGTTGDSGGLNSNETDSDFDFRATITYFV